MFFQISKLFWFFFAPSHVLVWLLLAGMVLTALGARAGIYLTGLATACLLCLLMMPVGDWLLGPIENENSRPAWPAHVDGVLELGGGIDGEIFHSRGVPGAEDGENRLVSTFELARHYPHARIVFSGGSEAEGVTEAQVARFIFGQMGLDPARVTYEDKSHDTWENFILTRALVHPKPGEVWLLATSAYHMPRAMAVARQVGWKVQPWPTDYESPAPPARSRLSLGGNIMHLDLAVHEWIGLLGYQLAGKAR